MSEELTDTMKKTLIQIGFGVSHRSISDGSHRAAFYDENNDRVDGRSIIALQKRGLVWGGTIGGWSVRIALRLTKKGEEMFERIRHEARQRY